MTVMDGAVDDKVAGVVRVMSAYKNVTQNELCAATGIPVRTFIRRMKHGGGWTAAELSAMATYFEIPVAWFYEGPDFLITKSRFFRHTPAAA
jgi:hypothetical protein